MILDTSFLIELLRENPDAFQRGVELAENGIPQRVPAPVLYELQYGAELTGDPDEKRTIENLGRLYPIVKMNDQLSRAAARLIADADSRVGGAGETGIDDIDPMVAAVADAVNEPVLTSDVEDFETLAVPVETW